MLSPRYPFYCFLILIAAETLPAQPIDENRRHTLTGNIHPLARQEFDRGPAPGGLPMERLLLVLKRSPEQETALSSLLEQQQDVSSGNYHQWLAPDEFGRRFGPDDADVQTVTRWLQSHGLAIARVSRGRVSIEFSGTASSVEETFHTPIHKFVVNGEEHWANAADPEVPDALAGAVAGIASLHNFASRPMHAVWQPQATFPNGSHAIGPADFATIYNVGPAWQSGINGTGTTIGVVGRSNFNLQDIVQFRSLFGLSANPPQIVVNGPDPGDLGGDEEVEAVVDVSWAGGVAPGATVKFVVSQSTVSTDGVLLSSEYIVDNNLADIMTQSFGTCEPHSGQGGVAFVSALAQQAAAQGITFLAASGDSGADACDPPTSQSEVSTLAVSLPASTPYTIAVGGTQFNDSGNPSQYWNSQNGAAYSSALQHIPENAWNESCSTSTCGFSANLFASGGGASAYFSKPSWQAGVAGIPADGKRDVPDVSLTAASSKDPYLICIRGSCIPNSQGQHTFLGVGGTSVSTPAFAGILALIVQKAKSRQGLANSRLYQLAAGEKFSQCDGSNTTTLEATDCIFNDVTVGNNAVPGEPGYGTAGALYQASTGYDQATGLGSVNVGNLLNSWVVPVTPPPPPPGPLAAPVPVSVTPQAAVASTQSMTFTFSDPRGWQDLGVVNILINNFLDGRQACFLAYSQPLGMLYLVADSGSGLLPGLSLSGAASGSLSNSQCTIAGAGSSAVGSGNTLTLNLNISFSVAFAGSKVIYLAARDVEENDSGWLPLGIVRVPGAAANTTTSVVGMSPNAGSGHSQSFTFTFADTKGWQDLGVVNVLLNTSLDGGQACYVAYARSTNTLYLFNDAGAPLPGVPMNGSGALGNGQCTVNLAGSSAAGNGNALTLTLDLTFSSTFTGNRIFYLAARDTNESNNTGWQALGSWTVE